MKSTLLLLVILSFSSVIAQDCEYRYGTALCLDSENKYGKGLKYSISKNDKYIYTHGIFGLLRVWEIESGNLVYETNQFLKYKYRSPESKNKTEKTYKLEWYGDEYLIAYNYDHYQNMSTILILNIEEKKWMPVDNVFMNDSKYFPVIQNKLYSYSSTELLSIDLKTGKKTIIRDRKKGEIVAFYDEGYLIASETAETYDMYKMNEKTPFKSIPKKKCTDKYATINYIKLDHTGKIFKDCNGDVYDISEKKPKKWKSSTNWRPKTKSDYDVYNSYCELDDGRPKSAKKAIFRMEVMNKKTKEKSLLKTDLIDDLTKVNPKKLGYHDAGYLYNFIEKQSELKEKYEGKAITDAIALLEKDSVNAAYELLNELEKSGKPVKYGLVVDGGHHFMKAPELWSKQLKKPNFAAGFETYSTNKLGSNSLPEDNYKRAVYYASVYHSNKALEHLKKSKGKYIEMTQVMKDLSQVWPDPRFKDFMENDFYSEYQKLIAANYIDSAIALEPNNPQAYLAKAESIISEGQYREGLSMALSTLSSSSTQEDRDNLGNFYVAVAAAEFDAGAKENAYAWIDSGHIELPNNKHIQGYHASMLMLDSKYTEAVQYWDGYLKQEPRNLVVSGNKMICLYYANRFKEAEKEYQFYNMLDGTTDHSAYMDEPHFLAYKIYKSDAFNDSKKAIQALKIAESNAKKAGLPKLVHDYLQERAIYHHEIKSYLKASQLYDKLRYAYPDEKDNWAYFYAVSLIEYAGKNPEAPYTDMVLAKNAMLEAWTSDYKVEAKEYYAMLEERMANSEVNTPYSYDDTRIWINGKKHVGTYKDIKVKDEKKNNGTYDLYIQNNNDRRKTVTIVVGLGDASGNVTTHSEITVDLIRGEARHYSIKYGSYTYLYIQNISTQNY